MKFVGDFHIHSKYARATSKDMNVENLDKWAKIKGIGVISPGEQECRPIARDVTYVEFVPRGHEAEAFLAGLGLGLIGGYLIPNPTPPLEASAEVSPRDRLFAKKALQNKFSVVL